MDPKILISVVAGIIVVGGGAWYLSTQQSQVPTTESTPDATEETAAETFGALMARTGDWECLVATDANGVIFNGNVYISSGKIRGTFLTEISGRTVTTEMIHTDGYVYTWSDLLPQGMKVAVSAAAGTAGGQGIDPSTPVQHSCSPWAADQSQFVVPSTITFVEIQTDGSFEPTPI